MEEIKSKDLDRGETIIALARALLSAEMEPDKDIAFRKAKVSTSRLTLCAVALGAALAASGATWFASQNGNWPVSRHDAIELEALTMYVAKKRNADSSELKRRIENRYGVRDYSELRTKEAAQAKTELKKMVP